MRAMHIPADNPLFALAVLVAGGALCGRAARRLHLPSVTGQILAGVLLGPSVLHVLGHGNVEALQPVIHFALGLIAVDVGTHLHLRRLRNSMRRLGLLLLCEATLTPLLVYLAVTSLGGQDWTFGLLFGTLAVSTAPATVLAIVKETRSKGIYVRTLIAAVALNNIACIALFEMAHTAVGVTLSPGGGAGLQGVLLAPLLQLAGAAAVGGLIGLALVLGSRHVIHAEQVTTVSIISIFLTTGVADLLGVSNLLSCLFLGMTIVNLAPEKEEIGHRVFANFEPAVLAVFFTLAGVELDFGYLSAGWLLVALFFVSRAAGKVGSGYLAMRLAGAPDTVRRYLGMGLVPQAGVAVGLLLQIGEDPLLADTSQLLLAVGVATVALNEIVGPLLTRAGLARSGNLGMDRARLIDFIHEENIVTGFSAESKEEALAKLVDLMITSHGLNVDREAYLADVLEREKVMSTCIGHGLAVPHGRMEGLENIVGVMAISRDGLPFATPDGLPLRCLVLLASPPEMHRRHLDVLAALARSLGSDWSLQLQIYNARTPAHVYEILHAEEFEDFNYFLDEDAAAVG